MSSKYSISRRYFMEAGILSAGGLALERIIAPAGVSAATGQLHSLSGIQNSPDARLVFSFDSNWRFFRPDAAHSNQMPSSASVGDAAKLPESAWEDATLPHSVRLEPRDVSGGRNYQGVSWYKKQFSVIPEWKGRVLYLTFQGAMQVADVWLNGEHMGTHYGGYLPFTLDVSKAVKFSKDNMLFVRLDNSDNPEVPPGKPEKNLDFVYFGGLYRSVQFQVLNPLHITDPILANKIAGGGVFVTYPNVGTGESTVQVQTELVNEGTQGHTCVVKQVLVETNGDIVASGERQMEIGPYETHSIKQELRVRDPKLWHPQHPHLYSLRTNLVEDGRVVDNYEERIGIRSIHFDNDRGLFLNGEPFFSVGANRHQDHPYVGYALPASAHYRDAYKLREAGFTSYRSHYPQDPAFMDACDEMGILAIVSNPGWQFVGDDVFKKRVYQDAREMIRRDRNRPSVVLWEAALNESDNSSIAAELYHIVHEEYPGPECYSSGDPIGISVQGFDGWDVEYGVWNGGDGGYRQGNTSRPWWIREWGDTVDNWTDQQGPARVASRWGEIPMLVQAATHLRRLEQIYSRERPSGADLWAGIDYYRGYNHEAFFGGPLGLFRLPKFDYYMFQSQRPADSTSLRIGSGPMVFIANFGTYYSPLVVTVFSNCEQVRLYQNGKEVATQEPDTGYHIPHPPFTFKVTSFSATHTTMFATGVAPSGTDVGELRAQGIIGGKVAATHLLRSPGVPTKIELEVDTCGRSPIANGADWVRVYAHIRDARGTTYPFADDMVTFSVTGEGSVIGNATIHANPLRAEAGIATALVRMTTIPGVVNVRASAPGLMESILDFSSEPNPIQAL